jgi:hypothetical protein
VRVITYLVSPVLLEVLLQGCFVFTSKFHIDDMPRTLFTGNQGEGTSYKQLSLSLSLKNCKICSHRPEWRSNMDRAVLDGISHKMRNVTVS